MSEATITRKYKRDAFTEAHADFYPLVFSTVYTEEFELRNKVKENGFSWEVESDSMESGFIQHDDNMGIKEIN